MDADVCGIYPRESACIGGFIIQRHEVAPHTAQPFAAHGLLESGFYSPGRSAASCCRAESYRPVGRSRRDDQDHARSLELLATSLRRTFPCSGGKLTLLCDLGSELQKIYSARPNKDTFISASPKLPYDDVVKVIDISKGAGVGDIGLLSEEIR